jgi:predicted RNA-binding protein YlqC (UPF0109 family)
MLGHEGPQPRPVSNSGEQTAEFAGSLGLVGLFEAAPMMPDVNHNDMQQLVTEIAKALVDDPQAVEVQAVARDENTVLRLRVASADVGKVIGKQGRTARSMRTILSAVSMKLHHRYTLDILEEDEAGKPAGS